MNTLRKPASFSDYLALSLKEKQKLWAEEIKIKKQDEKKIDKNENKVSI
jgi:hypothetical protein